ncbi:MAG: EF-hand domain-containing protein [Candidatus Thiodiazotropha sp.]
MKYFRKTLLMGALISMAGIATAQPPIPNSRGPLPFTAFDQNGDGSISQQEFDTVHVQRQRAPNPQGYSARRLYDPPQFSDFDQNGDGGLSPEELAEGQRSRMQQRQQQMMNTGQRPNMPAGGGMGPGMRPGMGQGMGRNMPSFAEFDQNGDGVLQQQEFEQARAERIRKRAEQGYMMRNLKNAPHFSSIDGNVDGVVSPEEFSAAQAQRRQP